MQRIWNSYTGVIVTYVCDTGWDESAEEGTRGEGGEKLKGKRQKETKHKHQEGEVKENASSFCPREPARQH